MNTLPAKIGYARISTADQNLDAQLAALDVACSGSTKPLPLLCNMLYEALNAVEKAA